MSAISEEPEDDLTLRGEIQTTSVPELLLSVLRSGETGLFVFKNDDITKTVYVQSGRIVFAKSNDPDERLGENLLVRGRITPRHYLEASRLLGPGRRLGALLVELRAIDGDDLIPAVENQVKDIMLDLFSWTTGDYELTIKQLPADTVSLNLSTENLILEGIRRSRSWTRVLRGIGSILNVPVPTGNTELQIRLELSEDEQEVLSHVNGRSSIEQICQLSYLSHFETCRSLWAMLVLGLIRPGLAGDAEAAGEGLREREQELDLEQIVEKFNQMFSRIYSFLKGRLGGEVDAFMDQALEEVSRQYGRLFDGVDLKLYGRADYETMLANVADLPAEQRHSLLVAGLNELVFVMQLSVRTRLGKEEEAVVGGLIKEGFRRIGTA